MLKKICICVVKSFELCQIDNLEIVLLILWNYFFIIFFGYKEVMGKRMNLGNIVIY